MSKFKDSLKFFLLALWLLFTSSMVAWWWFYGITQLAHPKKQMIMWEGGFFLTAIFLGAGALLIYIKRDQKRHEQLKIFFSTLSHDLKTSIARLRLQSEVLQESPELSSNVRLQKLIQDINRLDLQLENSLLLSQKEETKFLFENLKLSKLVESVRGDWQELEIKLTRDVEIKSDRRALISVFRNFLHNAVLHGKANLVRISVDAVSANRIRLSIVDDGQGFQGDLKKLGAELLNHRESTGNGVGLYLCSQLIQQLGGSLSFKTSAHGFSAFIEMPGHVS